MSFNSDSIDIANIYDIRSMSLIYTDYRKFSSKSNSQQYFIPPLSP